MAGDAETLDHDDHINQMSFRFHLNKCKITLVQHLVKKILGTYYYFTSAFKRVLTSSNVYK